MLSRKYLCLAVGLVWSGRLCAAEGEAPRSPAEDPLVQSLARSSAAFAADLLVQTRGRPENVAFAPVGLMQALLPVAAGVDGRARGEFAQTLHLGVGLPEAADGLGALAEQLQRGAGGADVLDFARSLWVRDSVALNPAYVDFLWKRCRSELRAGAFRTPEVAAYWMNRWITDRTGGRVRTVVAERALSPETLLVVGCAVHFQGEWAAAFDPAATADSEFALPLPTQPAPVAPPPPAVAADASPAGADPVGAAVQESAPAGVVAASPVAVPTMRRVAPLRLAALPGFRLVEVPFRGDRLALVVLLPAEGNSLAQVEAEFTAERMIEWLRAVRSAPARQVDLRLPRFAVAADVQRLETILQAAGITTAFDRAGAADFSVAGEDLAGDPLSLTAVNQVVHFAVTESGGGRESPTAPSSPAASATAAAPAPTDAPVEPPVLFAVNRPFLFWVCDRQTGCVVYLGRVVDPRAG